MDKMLAVVFNDEKTAYDGTRALTDMNADGDITVYAVAVIKKNADGTVTTKKVEGDFPIRTLTGTALGSLIGLLGGPVGMAAGAIAGTWAGLIGDVYTADVDTDFLSDVSTTLTPGKCALVAEVDEEWVTPIDTRMEALGGVVFRTLKSTVRDDHWSREAAAAKAELDQLKAEHAQARADQKARLQARIERFSKRVDAKLARAQTHSQQVVRELQARVKALQDAAEKAQGASKAALDARIAKLRSDYQARA